MSESEQFIYRKLEQVKEAGVIVSITSRLKIKKKLPRKLRTQLVKLVYHCLTVLNNY